jgi:hypothetical protein
VSVAPPVGGAGSPPADPVAAARMPPQKLAPWRPGTRAGRRAAGPTAARWAPTPGPARAAGRRSTGGCDRRWRPAHPRPPTPVRPRCTARRGRWAVRTQPGWQHLGLQRAGHERRALQLAERLDQAVEPATVARDAVPAEQEAGVRVLLDRLDLAAQRRQRTTAQLAQHVDVAELAAAAVGAELAAHHPTVGFQRGEGAHRTVDGDAEASGEILHRERPVGARIPAHQAFERVRHRLGERPRQAERRRARRLGASQRRSCSSSTGRRRSTSCSSSTLRARPWQLRARGRRARRGRAARAAPPRRAGRAAGRGRARARRPDARPAGVALVHVRGDPVEQQRLGERRRLGGVDRHHPHLAAAQVASTSRSAGRSNTSLQHSRVASSRIGKLGYFEPPPPAGRPPLALLPQRRALVGPAPGQQQRAGRALAEAGGEQRRAAAATP